MFEKLLSGRWILTLVAGAVFIYCAVTGTLTGEVGTIVAMVFTLYFTRQDRGLGAKK
jgi:hypothetical protein